MDIRFIDAGRVSGIRSQTIYHGLAKSFGEDSSNTIVLAQPGDAYFSIGYFQDAHRELDINYCREHDMPIVRRETGGGAVFLDSKQLFVQWIFHRKDLPVQVIDRYKYFIEPIVHTYKELGIEAYHHPVNDIHVRKKKIAGLGGAQIGEAQVITGNFLLDFDFDVMLNALNIKQKTLKTKTISDMNAYLTTIKKELKFVPQLSLIKELYKNECEKLFDFKCKEDSFSKEELSFFSVLDKKMLADDWLFKIEKPQPNHKMIKIHSGVWLGTIFRGSTQFEFQIKFGQLAQLVMYEKDKCDKLSVFDDMPLDEASVRQQVEKIFPNENQLFNKDRSYWLDILLEIVELRKGYG